MGAVVLAVLVGTVGLRGASTVLSAAENMSLPGSSPSPTAQPTPAKTTESAKKRSKTPAKKKASTKPSTRPTVKLTGPGTYTWAKYAAKSSSKKGRLIRYDVRVEKGLPINARDAGKLIHRVLNDKRSWSGSGNVRWEQVSSGKKAEMHAYIASPRTTDKLCLPLRTGSKVSCQNGNKVALNARRWVSGAKPYGNDVANYRRYLINHEFGHYIGHQHVECPGKGKPAPIMVQQTKGLDGCKANWWPAPKRR